MDTDPDRYRFGNSHLFGQPSIVRITGSDLSFCNSRKIERPNRTLLLGNNPVNTTFRSSSTTYISLFQQLSGKSKWKKGERECVKRFQWKDDYHNHTNVVANISTTTAECTLYCILLYCNYPDMLFPV